MTRIAVVGAADAAGIAVVGLTAVEGGAVRR